MMRLLLTGFEPFGGETVNPSAEVVARVAAQPPAGVEVTPLLLPVRGRISFERLVPAFEAGGFDAWLGVGQAGGRAALSVERVGINLLIDRGQRLPDETAGSEEQTLVEGGPAAYFSRLPVVALARRMTEAGAPSAVSNTAGAYICNEALYAMRHHLTSTGRDVPSGFIHLPYLPEQVADKPSATPSMALETQVLGVRVAIEVMRELVAARVATAAL
ncbi:MAG: pyroglutamyl-peptidase I [Dehalococcoidia bacterium]|nr:pyroglutamyl-peptidase I [Dehalococcoidia bacterium]